MEKLMEELEYYRKKYAFNENQDLCTGFEGGCDGDLESYAHIEKCPAYNKDKEIFRPYLYVEDCRKFIPDPITEPEAFHRANRTEEEAISERKAQESYIKCIMGYNI